jgi:membrane-bound inhibitor of C-type lysozyme
MRLVLTAAAFLALLGATACQTPCPASGAPTTTSMNYRCDDGSNLAVTFTHQPDAAHVVQEGYAPLDLPSRITGSGFRYAREGAELHGRGSDVRWERPGAEATNCHEVTT